MSQHNHHHHRNQPTEPAPVYESEYRQENLRSKSQTTNEQIQSHNFHLRKTRLALTCECKYKIKKLHDHVTLCKEMLESLCRPHTEAKNVYTGQYYMSQLLEEARHKHEIKPDDETVGITLEDLSCEIAKLESIIT